MRGRFDGGALLSVGARVMELMPFSRKFQLLMLIFLVPLGYGLWMICSEYHSKLESVRFERWGVTLLTLLTDSQQQIAYQRNLAAKWRAVDVATQGEQSTKSEMDGFLNSLEKQLEILRTVVSIARQAGYPIELIEELNAELSTISSEQHRLTVARSDAQALASWWGDAYNNSTRGLQSVRGLIKSVTNTSGLRRDPWPDTSQLINIASNEAPNMTGQLAGLVSVSQGIISAGSFNLLTRSQLRESSAAATNLVDSLSIAGGSIQQKSANDIEWYKAYSESLQQVITTIKQLENDFLKGDIKSLKADSVSMYAGVALAESVDLQRQTLKLLDQRLSVYQQAAWQGSATAVSVFGFMILVALYGVLCVQGSIKRSTAGITEVAQLMSQGDLRSKVEVFGKDELTSIGSALNTALEQLRSSLSGVNEQTQGVTTMVTVLGEQANSSLQAADSQKLQISLIASAATEMAATAQSVAETCEQAAENSSEARALAQAGTLQSMQTTRSIQALTTRLDQTVSSLEALKEQTKRIDLVMDVIKRIAEHTNLLALNASIEAARAGDQGRGFAVVADEVRELSLRTKDSTQEISGIVTDLQQVVQATATLMQQACDQAKTDARLVMSLGDHLAQISDASQRVSSMLDQIAAAAEQQAVTAEEVSSNILRVDGASTVILSNAHEVMDVATRLRSGSLALEANTSRFLLVHN